MLRTFKKFMTFDPIIALFEIHPKTIEIQAKIYI